MFIKQRQLVVVLVGLIEIEKQTKKNKKNAIKTNKKIKWIKFSLSKEQMKRGQLFLFFYLYSDIQWQLPAQWSLYIFTY